MGLGKEGEWFKDRKVMGLGKEGERFRDRKRWPFRVQKENGSIG